MNAKHNIRRHETKEIAGHIFSRVSKTKRTMGVLVGEDGKVHITAAEDLPVQPGVLGYFAKYHHISHIESKVNAYKARIGIIG